MDRIMTPKDANALISRTCEYIILHDRGDIADMIEVMNLDVRRLF